MPREGSFALASFGRFKKVQVGDSPSRETAFAVAFGRKSVALKRILVAVLESASSLTFRFAFVSGIIRSSRFDVAQDSNLSPICTARREKVQATDEIGLEHGFARIDPCCSVRLHP